MLLRLDHVPRPPRLETLVKDGLSAANLVREYIVPGCPKSIIDPLVEHDSVWLFRTSEQFKVVCSNAAYMP